MSAPAAVPRHGPPPHVTPGPFHRAYPLRDIAWVEQGAPEWDAMWQRLRALGEDPEHIDPETGEAWQYMGTSFGWVGDFLREYESTPRWVHCFRHRWCRGRRIYAYVRSTWGWSPNPLNLETTR